MAFSTYQYEFAGGDRTEKVKTIEFINTLPIQNVYAIKFFKEEDISGQFQSKEFRYSFDNVIWSNWNTLTQQNVIAIQTRDNPNFWINIRYTRTGIGAGNILRFYLFYDSDIVPPGPTPADASIDADFLGGQPPSYYLDRNNHTGPFLDLQAKNVPLGDPNIGVYHSRSDTSSGTTLYFKRLTGTPNISIVETSAGLITIDASGAATGVYDSALDPTIQMTEDIGGLPSGTSVAQLEGKTYNEIFDELLFPTAFPTLTNPNNTFVDNVNNLQEIGASINITFTSGFDRGSISPQYNATSPFRSGLPNSYEYTGAQIAGTFASTSLTDVRNASNYIVIQGNQSWQGRVNYDAGVQPYDSKGNPYLSPLPAGNTSYKSVSLEGVYPLFATWENIITPTKLDTLYSMISGNNIFFPLVNESGGNKHKFDIPVTWLTSRPLKGIQTYNTFAMQWEYQGGSQTSSLTFWNTSGTSHIIQGNSISYLRYTYNGVDRGNIDIRLIF